MITSTNNPKIKTLVQLQKKKKLREERGVFLVEGIRMFRETPVELIEEIYASESFYSKHEEMLLEKLQEMRQGTTEGAREPHMEVLTETVFQKISETKTPQGILCVVKRKKYEIKDILNQERVHIVVLEDLQDPGNVGTILRSAEAAGVTGIIVTKGTVDLYQAKTIRSTMGSIFRMPCVCVDSIEDAMKMLKEHEIFTFAAHLSGEKWYNEVDYTGKIAFLIGNEGNGLSKEASDLADTLIRIPMEGKVESLNAAIAATILMYEAYSQRR